MADKIVVTRQGKSGPKVREYPADEPAPTVQRFGIGDQRPTGVALSPDAAASSEPYPGKPPYRVPLVSEIAEVERNGLTVISTFSGCGGSCLGFEWAGYTPLLAVEFVPSAVDSYLDNHPGVPVAVGDIRELEAALVLERLGLAVGELDVLEGSPPCESFSSAGKRSTGWGRQRDYSDGISQRMDDLFYDFVRLLGGLRPRAFVAENVAGLVSGVSKGYFKRIHAALAEQGYRVEARMLDAQWLGVPQRRRRVIFVGVREDLGLDPAFPAPLPYRYSIRDALAGIAALRYDNGGRGTPQGPEDVDAPLRTLTNSHGASHHFDIERVEFDNRGTFPNSREEFDLDGPIRTIGGKGNQGGHFKLTEARKVASGDVVAGNVAASLAGYAIGEEWEGLAPGESSDRFFNLVRPKGDEPCPTVTAQGGPGSTASVTHPDEPRKFSIDELRRLCGFPDDFRLAGTYAQQWERLGNSVPPPMMFHVACALRDRVLLA